MPRDNAREHRLLILAGLASVFTALILIDDWLGKFAGLAGRFCDGFARVID